MSRPDTRYVAVGDADVAYQVLGEGPSDLLFFNGLGNHVEMAWENPDIADFLNRLASLRRLILLDRRGTGASDGVPRNAIPTWEEWTEDIESVLNEVGSERSSILATVDSGPIAILYAAAHPERIDSLVLCNTSARYLIADDYPIGFTPEALAFVVEFVRTQWGTPEFLSIAGSASPEDADAARRDALGPLFRASVTPRTAAAQYDYLLRNLDVRPVLPLIRVPTLVLSADNPSFLPIAMGRYVAEHIEGSKFVALPGQDMLIFGQRNLVFDEVAEFLTGTRPPTDIDRVLVSVLFTDIVGSTERAAALGDQRWRSLLDRHDQIVREQLRIFRGREINTTGDGFVASFDGPARAIRCGQAIITATRAYGMDLRLGLHTGECEVRGDDLGGLAVHIAARLGSLAAPGEVLVSSTVKDLVVGSGIEFQDRGDHDLKGVPGNGRLFRVEN
jgi:class 3 adenylate cyclase/alpha-beta hydrolase superfamily lysophospholipase